MTSVRWGTDAVSETDNMGRQGDLQFVLFSIQTPPTTTMTATFGDNVGASGLHEILLYILRGQNEALAKSFGPFMFDFGS